MLLRAACRRPIGNSQTWLTVLNQMRRPIVSHRQAAGHTGAVRLAAAPLPLCLAVSHCICLGVCSVYPCHAVCVTAGSLTLDSRVDGGWCQVIAVVALADGRVVSCSKDATLRVWHHGLCKLVLNGESPCMGYVPYIYWHCLVRACGTYAICGIEQWCICAICYTRLLCYTTSHYDAVLYAYLPLRYNPATLTVVAIS